MRQCPQCFRPIRCAGADCMVCDCGYVFPTIQEFLEQETHKKQETNKSVKKVDPHKGWVGPWINKK